MADTKTIISKVTLGVACPKKSAPKSIKNAKGETILVDGEFDHVELKHVAAGDPVTIASDEADALIKAGLAEEVKPGVKAKA